MNEALPALIDQARAGDRRAVELLLEEHMPSLRAFVRIRAGPLIRSKESSSDLVQSVCREVLGDLGSFEYRGVAAFRQWLFEAALRKIIDRQRYYRAGKRDPACEIAGVAVGMDGGEGELLESYARVCTPSRNAIAREEIERIEAALDALPEHYREVITLARILELPHGELAARMGRTEDSVRNLLSRALARLSSLIGER